MRKGVSKKIMSPASAHPSPRYQFDLNHLVATEQVSPDWAEALAPVQHELDRIAHTLNAERDQGITVLPETPNIFRAFRYSLSQVRVLIVGQDPYPTPGHPIGLAFACEAQVRPLPRSLSNIFRELADDLGILPPVHGDLSEWSAQGVMLLNRVLTVRAGLAGSHRGIGWEQVTECAIDALVARETPLVSVLWGQDAQTLAPRLTSFPILQSPHPSPLSASRGFFGSRPFSRVNALLMIHDEQPITWEVSSDAML